MASRELLEKVYALVAAQVPNYKGALNGHTRLADLEFSSADLDVLAERISAAFCIELDRGDLEFARTLTGIVIAVDSQVTQRQEDDAHERMESNARQAFEATYLPEYLASLSDRSGTKQDLVELLWAGFANGFRAGVEHQAK